MTLIYALLMFCILIFIHELGHFIAAKKCGVKVNKFALGMGPAIWKKQKGETEYSLRVFPIGGFCAMEGEDEESDDSRAYNNKKPWQKALIAFAGPLMNIILAFIILCIIAFASGSPTTSVGKMVEGSPAIKAGLKQGDKLLKVNDINIDKWEDVATALKDGRKGQIVHIEYERDGKKGSVDTKLMKSDDGRYIIGINPELKRNPARSIVDGAKNTWTLTTKMYVVIKQLFTGEVSTKELSGPVGIVYMVNQSASMGFLYFLYLMAIISLNLAIVNLLPLPALDGGRIVLIGIKKITGKAISDELEGKINTAGLILLLLLMVYVTWNDIVKFIIPIFN